MPPRILVLSASVGAGHLRAAQAVELALRQVVPEAAVQNVDVLQLTNAAFRRVYGEAYLDLVNKAPHVLGYFYDLLDRPPSKSAGERPDMVSLPSGQSLDISNLPSGESPDTANVVTGTRRGRSREPALRKAKG